MKLLKGFILTSTSQIVNLFALLIARILMARAMGPALYGGFGIGLNATTVLSKLMSLGTVPATQYYASKKSFAPPDFLRTVTWLTLTISAVVLVIGIGILPKLLSSYWLRQPTGYHVYLWMVPFIPIIMLGNSLSIVLIPWGKITQYTIIQLLGGVLIPVLFGLYLLLSSPLTAGILSQTTIWLIILAFNIWCIRNIVHGGSFQKDLTRNILFYGLKTWPNVILNLGTVRIAVLIGAAFVSESSIGHFVVALNLSEAIFGFHAGLGQLLLSEVSESEIDSFHTVQRVMRLSCTLFLVLGTLYFAFGKYFVLLFFGKSYSTSYYLSLILFGTGLAHGFQRILSNFFAGMGLPSRNTITLTCEVTLLAITAPLLSAYFNVYGLAIASASSALLGLLVSSYQSVKVMECGFVKCFVPNSADLAILTRKCRVMISDYLNKRREIKGWR